ncbi:hypothetical protein ACIHFD_67585 [Nonomuraea sp. NPDC051941]
MLCTPEGPRPFPRLAKKSGWPETVLAVGHDAIVTGSAELADAVMSA